MQKEPKPTLTARYCSVKGDAEPTFPEYFREELLSLSFSVDGL